MVASITRVACRDGFVSENAARMGAFLDDIGL
jgi:hypothetical protein